MRHKTAFSFLEISIVLIVISLIMAGVMEASKLVKSSRLANARTITGKSIVPDIKGLVAWFETSLSDSLKASENYDGAQISTWYDVSPSSIILKKNSLSKSASAGVTFVSDGINNIGSLKFSGSGNDSSNDTGSKISLSGFYQGSSARNTIFIVFRPTVLPSSYSRIFIDSGTGATSTAGLAANNSVYFNLGSNSNTATASNPANFAGDQNYILAIYFNGANSKAYLNNVNQMAGDALVNPGSNPLNGLTIGSDKNGGYSFNGLISEIIIYNRPIQNSERKDIFRYLSDKYKIPVLGF